MLLNAIRISRLKKYPSASFDVRCTITVKNNRELYRCKYNGICRYISLKNDGSIECTRHRFHERHLTLISNGDECHRRWSHDDECGALGEQISPAEW